MTTYAIRTRILHARERRFGAPLEAWWYVVRPDGKVLSAVKYKIWQTNDRALAEDVAQLLRDQAPDSEFEVFERWKEE